MWSLSIDAEIELLDCMETLDAIRRRDWHAKVSPFARQALVNSRLNINLAPFRFPPGD